MPGPTNTTNAQLAVPGGSNESGIIDGRDFRNKSPFRQKNKFTLSDINYTSTKKGRGIGTLRQSRPRPEETLYIREFQPDLRFNWTAELGKYLQVAQDATGAATGAIIDRIKKGGGRFSNVASGLLDNAEAVGEGLTLVGGSAAKLASEAHMQQLIDKLAAANGGAEWEKEILNNPVEQVRNMLSGIKVAEFQLPYDGEIFLTNQQADFWTSSADFKSALEGGGLLSILKDSTALNFPATPTWNPREGGGETEPISIDLLLYNNNIDSLIKNYKFVHGLMQGVYWSQIGNFQKSSNLYDIILPGRLRYFFCTLQAQITYVGKTRLLNEEAAKRLLQAFPKRGTSLGLSQDIVTSTFFPDAYKLNLIFKSLMPNNYNMYIQYFINGDAANKAGVLGVSTEEFKRLTDAAGRIIEGSRDLAATGANAGIGAFNKSLSVLGSGAQKIFGVAAASP
jgi:hypothetical protein